MNTTERIPFLDLVAPHTELRDELLEVFTSAIGTASFIGGPMVDGFEREFAAYCQTRHSIGVSSGTDALRFALMAAGVKPGDTVLTVPNTFIATTEAISQSGAHIDFVDVDERTYTLNPVLLEAYLTTQCSKDPKSGRLINTRSGSPVTAVIPVHLYGQVADMDPIMELAARYQLVVIEDACQAHGAQYFSQKQGRWMTAGSIGHAGAFSFYPGKNLGACGEAGAITTNDEQIDRQCRKLREHGQSKKYYHDIEGYNGRLDAIQAGILRVKLRRLPEWTEQRRACARLYDQLFAGAEAKLATPYVPEWSKPVYHLYVIRTADRASLQKALDAAGIGTGIHYPIPLHLTTAYASLGFKVGSFPVAESAAEHILSLPMFPTLSGDQQRRVAECTLASLSAEEKVAQLEGA
jgi:dTDP-4-amino-4,6-dideoxygalactose transaminase